MIYLCDFEDSFTYNIYADLQELKLPVTVIPFKEIYQFLQTKITSNEKEVIILGPGPGHPDEYNFIHTTVKSLLERKNLMLVGICLGHQLIWQAKGHACQHSATPVHGQIQKLKLFGKDLEVQRYNSLAIKLSTEQVVELEKNGHRLTLVNSELFASVKGDVLTYQFHPESVGTTCPNLLYGPINKFLL